MKVTNDRRKTPRVRLPGAAVIYDGRTSFECDGIDLSTTGVGVRSPVKIKKGKKVQVVLPVGEHSMTVAATVRRCRQEGRTFRLGLRFATLDPGWAQLLETFVEGAGQRDVRMYQAQVFLARTGAAELDKVFSAAASEGPRQTPIPGPASMPAPAAAATDPSMSIDAGSMDATTLERPRTGQNAIVVDESAPTGPNRVVDPKERPKTAAWAPTRPQAHESVDSPELRSAVANALSDLESELTGTHVHGAGADEETVMTGPPRSPSYSPPPSEPSYPPPAAPAASVGFAADLSSLDYGGTSISHVAPPSHSQTMIVDQRELAARSRGVAPPAPLRVEVAAPKPAAPKKFEPGLANLDFEDEGPTQLFAGDEEYEYVYERAPGSGSAAAAPAPAPDEDQPPSPFGRSLARPTLPSRSDQTIPSPAAISMATQVAIQAPQIPAPPGPRPNVTQFVMPQAPPLSQPPNPHATQISISGPPHASLRSSPSQGMPYGPVAGEATQVAIPAAGLPSAPFAPPAPSPPLPGTGQQPPSPFARVPIAPPIPHPPRPPVVPSVAPRPAGQRFAPPPSQQSTMGPDEEQQTRLRDSVDGNDDEFAAQYDRALADLDLESR
jgi:hypothetical protein